MGQPPEGKPRGLYDHVLQQLALAIKRQEQAGTSPMELEIEGLSSAEMGLIQAYLRQDAQWLAGWQAAASEQERIQRRTLHQSFQPDCSLCLNEIWPETGEALCNPCNPEKAAKAMQGDASKPPRHH